MSIFTGVVLGTLLGALGGVVVFLHAENQKRLAEFPSNTQKR